MMISFVMLTWNSERYLERCLASVFATCAAEALTCEIIVVDNGSSDGTPNILEDWQARRPEELIVIGLAENRGTTYTRNLALKAARGDFICVIDSDTEICGGSLQEVLDHLDDHAEVGLVAPRLLLPQGGVQHSVKRFPTFLDKLAKIPGIVSGHKVARPDFYPDFPFQESRVVDTAISACWIFRRTLLDRVGLLDEKIFYAPEDVEFCMRVKKGGYSILYFPRFTLWHHTQQITHRSPFSRTSRSHFKGLLYYYWKHGGWLRRPTSTGAACVSSTGGAR